MLAKGCIRGSKGRSCDSRTDSRRRAMLAKGRAASFGNDNRSCKLSLSKLARGRIGSSKAARCLFALLPWDHWVEESVRG